MKIKTLFVVTLGLLFFSCTENQRAKAFGGTMYVTIPKGNKVTNITWKQDDLWYSYRPFEEGEVPTTTKFVEQSSFGIVEGEVIFTESE